MVSADTPPPAYQQHDDTSQNNMANNMNMHQGNTGMQQGGQSPPQPMDTTIATPQGRHIFFSFLTQIPFVKIILFLSFIKDKLSQLCDDYTFILIFFV